MIKILTLDCETTVGYPKGDPRWEHPERMPIAILGLQTEGWGEKEHLWYTPNEDVAVLMEDDGCTHHGTVQQILNTAEIVLTFNGERFDFSVLEGSGFNTEHARAHSYDLMAQFQAVSGHRIRLVDFSKALGVQEKTLVGPLAVQLWQAAHHLMVCGENEKHQSNDTASHERREMFNAGAKHLYQSVIDYCLDDVKITRACFDAMVGCQGYVRYKQKGGYRGVQLALP